MQARSGITSAEQLFGKTVATTTGTTLVQRLRKLERDSGASFNLLYGKDHADSFLLLESGRADAFAMDDNTLAFYREPRGGVRSRTGPDRLRRAPSLSG